MRSNSSVGSGRDKAISLWGGAVSLLIVFCVLEIFTLNAQAQGPGTATAPDISVSAGTKAQVIRSLSQNLTDRYVFPEVAEKLAKMLEDHEKAGDYASVTRAREFSQILTSEMNSIAHDAHLRVYYEYRLPPAPKPGEGSGPAPRMIRAVERDNFGFEEVKRFGGDVGYLKVTGFPDAERGGPTVAAAMTFLSNTEALILDLRKNRGGDPGMVDLLASYFFAARPPVHLNDLSWRREGTTRHSLQQFWTLPYVPGKRYLNKEVYILVSHETPSAAEEFTYDLQALKRAVVVGEPTWGGANPGGMVPLAGHFLAFIPAGEAINPTTKTNWEGKGIQPDVKTPAQGAFRVAYKMALQHLIATTKDDDELSSLKSVLARRESGGSGRTEP